MNDKTGMQAQAWVDVYRLCLELGMNQDKPTGIANVTAFITRLHADNVRLKDALELAKALADAGEKLSEYAASIHWDGGGNEDEWLDGLRGRIMSYQSNYEQSLPHIDAALLPASGGESDGR